MPKYLSGKALFMPDGTYSKAFLIFCGAIHTVLAKTPEPKEPEKNDAYILEFKVHDAEDEENLQDTVAAALHQIEEKQYAAGLLERGITREHIHSYGFAFRGKNVLIGKN